VVRPAQELGQEVFDEVLEVRALGGRPCSLTCSCGGRGLDGAESLIEVLESAADLGAELVERRSHPRRVEQLREPRGVAIEEGAQQDAHPPDGGVTPLLIEELAGERPQLTAVAEEGFQRSRQATLAIREVRAQHLIHPGRETFVENLRLADHGLELATHGIHIERCAGVLQAVSDAQSAQQLRRLPRPSADGRARPGRPGEVPDDQPIRADLVGQGRDRGGQLEILTASM
jgi:hypothetical protein